MGYLIRMPQMGMEMDEGEVVAWEVDEGETAEEGEVLAVVESEKATNEVEAREDGVLRRVLVEVGGTVEPGTSIGILADPDEDLSRFEDQLDGETAPADDGEDATAADAASGTSRSAGSGGGGQSTETVRATPGATQLADEEGVDLAAVRGTGPQGVVTEDDVADHLREAGAETGGAGGAAADVRASPGAGRAADELGVDVAAVEGTGPEGVIIEDDVRRHAERTAAEPEPEPAAGAAGAVEAGRATRTVGETRELSGVQRTVSDRLGESYRNAVHVTVNRSFDAGALRDVAAAAEAAGLDVSLSDLLVRAVGEQLAEMPAFNALFEDGQHKLIEEVNVGVAVDVEGGLVTPVVPAVDARSVEEVAAVRGELVERATSGGFTSDDLAGGTFTISNLGMFGVDHFDPVINPPEVAILGVGRIRDDGTMTLSLSFDHRVVNGADGAKFLAGLVGTLTDPLALADLFETDVLGADGVRVSVSVAD
ncbi:dihydrolipoyllysine acetyltransferase [Halobacteriales archaeon QS_1_68_17]|nr:MAG: dihydrolipoyllysine acetyltransferase [Halobacteriales archaeon QS_1_68_17]